MIPLNYMTKKERELYYKTYLDKEIRSFYFKYSTFKLVKDYHISEFYAKAH